MPLLPLFEEARYCKVHLCTLQVEYDDDTSQGYYCPRCKQFLEYHDTLSQFGYDQQKSAELAKLKEWNEASKHYGRK